MAEPIVNKEEEEEEEAERTIGTECSSERMSRKEKRKAKKKMMRKQMRKEMAEKEREEEEARLRDPEEQRRLRMIDDEEKERVERARREFEERERAWIEAMERKKKEKEEEEEQERRKALEEEEEESKRLQVETETELGEGDDWEYVEEGPAEIIWQGNEITVKKKKVRVPKRGANQQSGKENADRPTSNPLPPQSEAFANYKNVSVAPAEQIVENATQQVPNFGTEQDKAHCPFHLKTGACRFGLRCSRVHFYPEKSCTLLIRNMYNGPGLAWEQDEGLEFTDEEVERSYEEFYEDVHTEFLKFGEIVNFKVCRNGSFHLRGNVYVQYKSLDSAVLVYHSINGRYFAGKQVRCEFVNVTRWKVAICGEYMKSRFKTCSHGTACNFIHCFRNPGGDYEWADFDKPPPKYWVKKMAALFGYSDEAGYEKQVEQENLGQRRYSSKMSTDDRCRSRRSRSKEMDYLNSGGYSTRNYSENEVQKSTQWRSHAIDDRKRIKVLDENMSEENAGLKDSYHRKSRTRDRDSDGEWLDKDGGGDRYRDTHHRSARKSSRHQNNGGKHRTDEAESEGDWSDESEDRETHNGHARKRSRHSRKAKFLDQEKVGGDWSDREGDRETRHAHMTKISKCERKVGHSDDHEDSKNRTHDTDGERSDRDRDRDRPHKKRRKSSRYQRKVGDSDDHGNSKSRSHDPEGEWSGRDSNRDRYHSRRRKSSGQDRKVSESSDDHGIRKSRADDTNISYDGSGSDGEKHRSQTRKHNARRNEVSEFSDDEEEPAKKLRDKFHSRESSIDKSDLERGSRYSRSRRMDHFSRNENLKSEGSHESSSSGQYFGRYEPHDLDSRYNSDKYNDEPEPDRSEPD
ncbi:zinc finger CCCH domain-containing protein 5 isoform X1 [Corylus avellana]|uniref:zinc finger CCCH domain-containing protein 5 isoform X1 n=1 Tax=Corylus avellana TaxID=13451 RepID=UPI00286BE083|nr:zinc finger CCCH domain-containing protein 5 isoform X1 [Corylus avellana]